ncbi:MAG: hypothetical protein GQ535_03335 [Rhodobacteraceae bacterium]|nr:hypothetical protein [Paracoccaceae bacterium]
MRFLILTISAILSPFSAYSQQAEFAIDYEALFHLHPDRIAETDRGNFQVLNMPGGIVVDRLGTLGNYRYSGTDTSDSGAVRCMAMILIEYKKLDMICPHALFEVQCAELDVGLERVLRFYAENTYPQALYEALGAYVRAQIEANGIGMLGNKADYCDGNSVLSHFAGHYNELSDDSFQRDLDKILEVPRLPVENDCL